MLVLVNHPDGMNLIDKVGFFDGKYLTDLTFNDDGMNGDTKAGDGIYTFQTELANFPQEGQYILPVVAKDVNGNYSNMFPYIHIIE